MVRHDAYWTTITDCNGVVEQELNFDAWGKRRNPENWLDTDQLPEFRPRIHGARTPLYFRFD